MIIEQIKKLPTNSGVYQYFDENGKILYVGKAKNLKNRIKSYFSFTPSLAPNPNLSQRISLMISQAKNLNFIITKSESDALILENSLIKELNPKYNILLRDDKTYPYIYIDFDEDFPRFEITRKVIDKKNVKYFGPFSKGANEFIAAIYLNFNLIQKKSCLKSKKACLFYQIKRCYAPCENLISKQDYAKIIEKSLKALKNPNLMIPNLNKKMLEASKNENYEEAIYLRDIIKSLQTNSQKIEVDLAKLENFEVLAVCSLQNRLAFSRFTIFEGRVIFTQTDVLQNQTEDLSEAYKSFILNLFKKDTPINFSKIYIYDEIEDKKLLQTAIFENFNYNIKIQTPKIGNKRKLTQNAYENAKLTILNSDKNEEIKILQKIKDQFNLNNFPQNIEVFDNSHMFGQAIVGAMINYNNGFVKQNYRHFHLNTNSDYEQMKESLTLRVQRFNKLKAPDLWLIDGGDALVNLANEILKSIGANVDVLGIAKEKRDNLSANRSKGKAKDKIITLNEQFSLNPNDKSLQFLQKLRDEAHRFAISFHQKTKRKNDLESSSLKKLGLSDGEIKKLLNYFGNFETIRKAKKDEIKKIINKELNIL